MENGKKRVREKKKRKKKKKKKKEKRHTVHQVNTRFRLSHWKTKDISIYVRTSA